MTRPSHPPYRTSLLLALLLLTNTLYDRWQHAVSTPAQDFFILWSVPRALTANPSIRLYTDAGERAMASTLKAEAAPQSRC